MEWGTLWTFWRLFPLSYLSFYQRPKIWLPWFLLLYLPAPTFARPLNLTPLLLCVVRLCPCLNPERFLVLVSHHAEITSPSMPATRKSMPPSPSENLSDSVGSWELGRLSGTASIAVNLLQFSRRSLNTRSSQRDFNEPIPLFSRVIVAFLVAHLAVSKA